MTVRTLVVISFLPLLIAVAPAQTDGSAEELLKKTSDWEVEVVFENQAVFRGVVLDDRFVEQPFRARYKLLDEKGRTRRRAGIRLWYYNDLQGYLFLPYRQIKSVRKVRRLTKTDIDGIRAGIARFRQENASAAKAGQRVVSGMKSADRIGAAPDALSRLTAEQRRLLEEYPPREGWVPEFYSKIQKDCIILGTELTAEQKRWSGVYPEWLAAYRALTGEPEKKAAPRKPAPKTAAAPVKKPVTSPGKKGPAPTPKKTAAAPAKKTSPGKKPMTSLEEALKAPSGSTVKKSAASKGRGLK